MVRPVRRVRSRVGGAALLLLPVLGVAGCSGDAAEPEPAPPTSSDSSGSPTVSGSPSGSPSAVQLSPEETVRAWVEAQNEALRSGDTRPLAALSKSPCKTCDQFIDPIEQVHAQGGYFRGGTWKVEGIKARGPSGNRAVVDVAITIAGGTTKESANARPIRYGSAKHLMEFRLAKTADGYVVSFLGFLS